MWFQAGEAKASIHKHMPQVLQHMGFPYSLEPDEIYEGAVGGVTLKGIEANDKVSNERRSEVSEARGRYQTT